MTRALKIFQTLCEDLGAEELTKLRADVREHYESLLVSQRRNELIAVDLAELLCTRLEALLEVAHLFESHHRAKVVGAARYFVSSEDEKPDERACTGLDDDVQVFNEVARELGRLELVIAD